MADATLALGGKLLLLGAVAGGLVLSLVWLAGAADRVVVWAWAALGLLILGYSLLSLTPFKVLPAQP